MGGLVTYTLPVEAFVTGSKISDQWKMWSIAWLFPSEALDNLIYKASFPGPPSFFSLPERKSRKKMPGSPHFSVLPAMERWAGPGNKAKIYSHLRGNWWPSIVTLIDLLIFAGFTLVGSKRVWFLDLILNSVDYTPWFRNNSFHHHAPERLFMTNASSPLD